MSNTYSALFVGANTQYLYATNSSSISITGDFTIEFWIKPVTPANNNGNAIIIHSRGAVYDRGYELYYFNYSNVQSLNVQIFADGSNTNCTICDLPCTLSETEWTHVAVTCDISNLYTTKFEWFINGVSQGNGNASYSGTDPSSIYASSQPLMLGQISPDNIYAPYSFDGKLSDVRIWSVIRTQQEIQDNMFVQIDSASGLNVSYHLNKSLVDSSGNGNTLSNANGVTFTTDVPTSFLPAVTTLDASDITNLSATLNGEITSVGSGGIDEVGFVYDTTAYNNPGNVAPNDTDYGNSVTTTGSFDVGTFNLPADNLTIYTEYYVRAYVHNAYGYVYADGNSFYTLGTPNEIRDFTNKPGAVFTPSKTTVIYAEDLALIKQWIEYLNSKI